MGKKSIPRLIVFFDTNALYTQVASDLVRAEIRQLITENSKHVDLDISWHLPEIVVNERRFQMMSRAKELLPNLQKMERLLGHAFGVGDDTLELHVNKAIDGAFKQLNFQMANFDTTKVNWEDVIYRSAFRCPPFERGEKEKGFRDAIIANTFAQMQKCSPSTPNVCRLAIVTNDERLTEYIHELTVHAKNVRILKNTDELESLINTLVSSVPEEFAAELAKKAAKLFFAKGDDKSLYYKESIGDRIKRDFAEILEDTILDGHHRESTTWWITNPIFVNKTKQRIHWVSVIETEFEIYHYENKSDDSNFNKIQEGMAGIWTTSKGIELGSFHGRGLTIARPKGLGGGLLSGSLLTDERIVDLKGLEKFEVHWSASITQMKSLTKPSIDEIKHLGNNLSENL